MLSETNDTELHLSGDMPVVLILDARHRIEERLLQAWCARMVASAPARQVHTVTLPISDERRGLDLQALRERLAADPETLVVPVRVFWRIPGFDQARGLRLRQLLFGDPRAPGALRARWMLLRDRRRAFCFAGQPATIGAMREEFESSEQAGSADSAVREDAFTQVVLRRAGLSLDIAERGLRGTRYKVPKFVAENLHANPAFAEAVAALSAQSGQPLAALEGEADKYMAELISRPRPLFIDLKAWLERTLLSMGYDNDLSVDPAEVERFRRIIREKPTLVLFTHKTYLDGLAATDIAYRNDMPLIHTFGGINMAMPGLSTMMRGAGGIFIRRSFRDNPLYKLVLRFYISYLLEKRFPMTWAFEGTRSRTGKLSPPRFGLLKYVIDSAHSNGVEDLHFLPVSTSFDLIRDVDDYVAEQSGALKKPESLGWFIGYMKSLREPRGRIYVNFGEPVVVHKAPDPDDKLALAKIAFEVAVNANRVTPFTLNALICLILLGSAPRGMTAGELHTGIGYLVDWGRRRGIRMSDTLDQGAEGAVEQQIETLLRSGLFNRYDQGSQVVYSVEPAKHPVASYYRNTIIHHFLERAIIELSLLKAREDYKSPAQAVFWAETSRLRDLFKFEFFYPEKEEFRANLEAELRRICEDWRERLQQGGTRLHSLVARCQPLVGHAVFLPLAEAYMIVLLVLSGLQPGESLSQKDCVAKAIREGRVAYLMRRVTSEASISRALFETGYQMAEHLGLAGATDARALAGRKALLREFRDLLRRMETSRIEGLREADKLFDEVE